ncbi:carbonyl reductase [NADPH] 1-like [Pieris rapae]|uniref:carbonyl reductase [NADPH] 1-like n=1 Tax=Pieris rapae TaxID=64459 RepID=UPI001E27E283|nr:carbonyl reductase [NADPH] 1-like [Pieris rapae]
MIDKVAVVTGANKGIGYGIVNQLCKRGVKVVYLTARDETKGRGSVKALEAEGYHPIFHQLDVTDGETVKNFADFVKNRHAGIDILINNAGIRTHECNKKKLIEIYLLIPCTQAS